MLFAIILVPLLCGLAALLMPFARLRRALLPITAVVHSVLTLTLSFQEVPPALSGWLAVDGLGYFFLVIVSIVFLLTAFYTVAYLKEAGHEKSQRVFIGCMLIFLSTMSLVTLSQHLGLLWVAVEATTLVSAPLIFFHRSARSLEAVWKYLIICSVGIALALLGTFFLAAAVTATGLTTSLLLQDLVTAAGFLDVRWLQASFIFLFVGYGTKMGLAPMHTWLPDAHSEAPSPVSALLSGVLLNCAFLALLRMHQICLAAGQADFSRTLFLVFGLLSMFLAAVFMLHQNDYKRLLAYSSVEHMGILGLATALGPAAAVYVMLHSLNHSLTKSMLFLTSGNILSLVGSKSMDRVRGLLHSWPVTGLVWSAGLLAIGGAPPFGLFISEFNILGIAISGQRYFVTFLYLLFLTIAFIALIKTMLNMSFGPVAEPVLAVHKRARVFPIVVLLIMIILLGIYIPDWLYELIRNAAKPLGGV
jgi:hydrogenase-4 component F